MAVSPLALLLDFDGVLNNDKFLRRHKNHPGPGPSFFAPENIAALNSLCTRLPVEKIVVSSTWRVERTLEQLREMLSSDGFAHPERVLDVTPEIEGQYGASARAAEIRQWIAENQPATTVILDDYDLGELRRNGFYRVNSATGLTDELVAEIVRAFGEQ